MNLNPNGTMFLSITTVDEATHRYMVCLHATPPHIVSDGLWGSGATNRKPVKSFLPLFELQVLVIFVISQICRLLLKP